MRKLFITILTAILLSPALAIPAYAVDYTGELDNAGTVLYDNPENASLVVVVVRLINAVLGLVSLILLIMVIYGGFTWMTAGGKPDQVSKAKSILVNAVIGLIIVLGSFIISSFVINSVQSSASGPVTITDNLNN